MQEKSHTVLLAETSEKCIGDFRLKEEIEKIKSISRVDRVQSGKEAFEKLAAHPFSILLTEGLLSDMEGTALIKKVVESGYKVPVVVLVNPGDEELAADAMKIGADDYLVKEEGFLKILPKIIDKTIEQFNLASSLRVVEERYIETFEHASDSIFIYDINGKILDVNANACRLLGYKKDELNKMSLRDILSSEVKVPASEIIKKIISVKSLVFESSYKKKNGLPVSVELSTSFFVSEGKEIILTFVRDITKRKNIEKDLRLLANITTHTAEAIISVDDKENITSWNKGAEKIFGYREREIIGKPYKIVVPKEGMEQLLQIIKEVYEKGHVTEIDGERITKHGEQINVQMTSSIIKDEKGRNIGRSIIVRDITERKQMEEKLLRSSKLAALGTLAAGIAHEFNNILTAMLGYAELGLMTKDTEKMKKALEVVMKSSERAKSITDNLLTFARKHESKRIYTDIREAINSSIALVKREFQKDNIRIKRNLAKTPTTYCAPGQISQVCLNLLTNARDAMLKKGGTIRIDLRKKNAYLELKFSDTGCGISPELKKRIFEPFVTTKGPRAGDASKGTGLGLSVSYGIVQSHNGTIEVESEKNKGSAFTIKLPIVKEPMGEVTLLKSTSKASKGRHLLKILVVDDEKEIRSLFEEVLKREGHFISVKKSVRAAMGMLKKEKFDLVFTDITMPGVNGLDFLKKAKKIDDKLKIVLMSGQVMIFDDIRQALSQGAAGFLRKPFKTTEIVSMIDKTMSAET